MLNVFQTSRRVRLAIVGLSCFVCGCNEVSSMDAPRPMAVSPPDWETICIDRLLIDIPKDVEMGASDMEFRSPYGVAALNDRATRGPTWRTLDISETDVADSHRMQSLKHGVMAESAKYLRGNAEAIFEAKRQIEIWEERFKLAGSVEEKESTKDMLSDGKVALAAALNAKQNSGEAKEMPPNTFAFRRGDEFTVGLLSKMDGRARTFTGRLTHPEITGPKAAAAEWEQLSRIYQVRKPAQIPPGPGFCTPHGFFNEAAGGDAEARTEIFFRSTRYPNLVFTLEVEPATESKNIQSMPNMAAREALLDMFDVKRSFGPVAVQMLGAPGRLVGQEYKAESCFAPNPCRPPDQAYEFEAETYGELGNLRRPRVVLSMQALLSDDYKSKLTTLPGNEKALEIRRGSLKGAVPPDVAQGRAIFERVLNSIRLRPDAIVDKTGS